MRPSLCGPYVLPHGALSGAQGAADPERRERDRGGHPPHDAGCRTPCRRGHLHGCPTIGRTTSLREPAMARHRHPGGADDSVDIRVCHDEGDGCVKRPSGIYEETPASARPATRNPALRSGQRDGHAQAPGPAAQNLAQLCHATRNLDTPAPAFTPSAWSLKPQPEKSSMYPSEDASVFSWPGASNLVAPPSPRRESNVGQALGLSGRLHRSFGRLLSL